MEGYMNYKTIYVSFVLLFSSNVSFASKKSGSSNNASTSVRASYVGQASIGGSRTSNSAHTISSSVRPQVSFSYNNGGSNKATIAKTKANTRHVFTEKQFSSYKNKFARLSKSPMLSRVMVLSLTPGQKNIIETSFESHKSLVSKLSINDIKAMAHKM